MGFISPNELNRDPKLWLGVPHELHDSLSKLMEILFPGFQEKLEDIHCLECEGEKPFEVITKDTLQRKLCVGFVGKLGKVEFLHLENPPQ